MMHTALRALMTGAFAATLAAAATSCSGSDRYGSSPNDPPDGASVNASATGVFAPNIVQVVRGQPVTWVFGAVEHNVTFVAVAGAPSNIEGSINTEVSRTFNTAGSFAYSCTIHAGMSGSITVTGSNPGGY